MSLVVKVLTYVVITIWPLDLSSSLSHILFKCPFVKNPFLFSILHVFPKHDSLAVFVSLIKASSIETAIGPIILPVSLWKTVFIATYKSIPFGVVIFSLAMFLIIKPKTYVFITILPSHNSMARCLTLVPFSFINLSSVVYPFTFALPESFVPLSIIEISVSPPVCSFPTRFPILIASLIFV